MLPLVVHQNRCKGVSHWCQSVIGGRGPHQASLHTVADFCFFGKTVFSLTNNLHGRTRRRRGKHQGRGEGAKGAAARGAPRSSNTRGRRPRRRAQKPSLAVAPRARAGGATRVDPTSQGCM